MLDYKNRNTNLRKISKILLPSLLIGLLASCTGTRDLAYGNFDNNKDGLITKTEFKQTFKTFYHSDRNDTDDPYLEDEDFHAISFTTWDANNDGEIKPREWRAAFANYHEELEEKEFGFYDANNDGRIVYKEYSTAVVDNDFYHHWDTNNNDELEESELAVGVFNHWDTNNDGILNRREYKNFDIYFDDI